MNTIENDGWKISASGEWITTPEGVTISQNMISSTIKFVDQHTSTLPPVLVYELKKHLHAQSLMVEAFARFEQAIHSTQVGEDRNG